MGHSLLRDRTVRVAEADGPAAQRPHKSTAREFARLSRRVALTDILALEAALALSWAIRYGYARYGADLVVSMLLGPLVLLSVFTAFSLYELQRISPVEEFRRTLGGVGLTVILVGVTEGIVSDLLGFHKAKLSLEWVVTTLLAALLLVVLFRRQWHKHVWAHRQAFVWARSSGASPTGSFPWAWWGWARVFPNRRSSRSWGPWISSRRSSRPTASNASSWPPRGLTRSS